MTTDKLICTVESGKYERAIFVVCEEYTTESTFLAKLSIRVWFNVFTELEEYPYLHALLFVIEFLDFAGLGERKRLLLGHWPYEKLACICSNGFAVRSTTRGNCE